jgi:hypothetical protein
MLLARRPRGPGRIAAGLLVVSTVGLPAQARVVEVGSTALCSACAPQIVKVATIGRPTDSVLVMNDSWMVADSREHFLVAPVSTPGAIALYDSGGRLVRTIGRQGSRPGEYGEIDRIWLGVGDTLYVYDYRRFQLTVLTPTYEVARTHFLPTGGGERIALPGGQIVISAMSRNPDRVGHPLHIYSPTGQWVRSFGGSGSAMDGAAPPPSVRFAPVRGDSFWIADRGRYEMQLWTARGSTPIARLIRVASFFEPYTPTFARFARDGRILPFIAGLRRGDSGLLWVSLYLADPAHRPSPSVSTAPTSIAVADYPSVFEGMIEILDPDAGSLVASFALPQPVQFVEAPRAGRVRVYAPAETSDGYRSFGVWRITVPLR